MQMEVRINVDERDLEQVRMLTGIADPQALIQYLLRQLVRPISAETLVEGGWDPLLQAPPRRRPPDFRNEPPMSGPQSPPPA